MPIDGVGNELNATDPVAPEAKLVSVFVSTKGFAPVTLRLTTILVLMMLLAFFTQPTGLCDVPNNAGTLPPASTPKTAISLVAVFGPVKMKLGRKVLLTRTVGVGNVGVSMVAPPPLPVVKLPFAA